MAKNPLLQQKFEEGFEQGMLEAKAIAAASFSVKLERLAAVKGIGQKTFEKIIWELQQELTPEEKFEVKLYVDEYRLTRKSNSSKMNRPKGSELFG